MNPYRFTTILTFKTISSHIYIDDAMLAVFPLAEWNETRNRSTFMSDTLSDSLVDAYFDNAEQVKGDMTHKFDVYSEHEVSLTVVSEVQPKFRRINPYEALTDAKFVVTNYFQHLA